MKRSQIKEGMVFGVPMPNNTLAVVQLIRKDKPIFYMAGFDLVVGDSNPFEPAKLFQSKVLFLGNFFDDLIKNDHWLHLGNGPVQEVPFPNTRVLITGEWVIESWDRKKRVTMKSPEAERFPYRSNHGSILLEEALLNYHGFLDMDEYVQKHIPQIRAAFVQEIAEPVCRKGAIVDRRLNKPLRKREETRNRGQATTG